MHGGSVCLVEENREWNIFEGPTSQGSRTIVKALLAGVGVEGGEAEVGSKVRRKDVSELRCFTVKDILAGVIVGALGDLVVGVKSVLLCEMFLSEGCKAHGITTCSISAFRFVFLGTIPGVPPLS